MNILTLNMHIWPSIKNKYGLSISILPTGFMFGSFGVLFYFGEMLLNSLGIPIDAPVKDQSNAGWLLGLFLVFMVLLMISGVIIGWLANAIIACTFFGWSTNKARRVFLYSEVPDSWLKDGTNLNQVNAKNHSNWAVTREKGRANYIIKNGVLFWGGFMYLIMAVSPALRSNESHELFFFVWQAGLWGSAGALFGFIVWQFSEKQYLKKLRG